MPYGPYSSLCQCPQKEGLYQHVSTRTLKKPNSALCKIAKSQINQVQAIRLQSPSSSSAQLGCSATARPGVTGLMSGAQQCDPSVAGLFPHPAHQVPRPSIRSQWSARTSPCLHLLQPACRPGKSCASFPTMAHFPADQHVYPQPCTPSSSPTSCVSACQRPSCIRTSPVMQTTSLVCHPASPHIQLLMCDVRGVLR
ncbi:ribosomal protein S12 [Striga asiatica]|uniref:Ribosomal protein S12 n=1 Tax=Striga asiatica TaxID=4170 RepID=A0A5A7P6R1_STRAF|nr:ribosomal protein S12 [Striga asiatica]